MYTLYKRGLRHTRLAGEGLETLWYRVRNLMHETAALARMRVGAPYKAVRQDTARVTCMRFPLQTSTRGLPYDRNRVNHGLVFLGSSPNSPGSASRLLLAPPLSPPPTPALLP